MRQGNAVRKLAVGLDVVVTFTHSRDNGRTMIYKGTKGYISRVSAAGAVAVLWGLDTCETYYTSDEDFCAVVAAFEAVEKWGTGRNRARRVVVDTAYRLVK